MTIRFFLIIFLSFTYISLAENLNLIDNYSYSSFDNIFKESNNKKITKKVNKIVSDVNNLVNYKKILGIKSLVINDKSCPNAFAAGNGNIYMCEDLAKMLNKCELTYVIAHEISHIYNEDYKNTYNRLKNTLHDNLDDEINFHLTKKNKYSRIQETIADRDAVVWSLLLGCKEAELVSAANRIFKDIKIKNSTHPDKDSRLETIRNMTRKFKFVKNNNYQDAQLLYDINDFIGAQKKIEEYILYNFNDPIGYKMRIKINSKLNKNSNFLDNYIKQDCEYLSKFFNINYSQYCK